MLEIVTSLLTNLLNKAFMLIFFIGVLYSLRHLILFLGKLKNGQKYDINQKELLYLGGSVAIILTIIFSGIKLI